MENNEIQILNNAVEIARIEIDTQIATAKQYPREVVKIIRDVTALSTMDKETAASCFYAKPIGGGKVATGASVRFAEIVLAMWGNIRLKSYISNETDKAVIAVAEIHDLEKNIAVSSEVSVSIITQFGKQSANQIEVTKMAAQSKARRNAILTVIPKGFFNAALEKIKNASVEDVETASKEALKTSFDKAVLFYAKKGVTINEIYKALAVIDEDEITKDHLIILGGFRTAINEKTETIDSIFRPEGIDNSSNVDFEDAEEDQKGEELFKDEKK